MSKLPRSRLALLLVSLFLLHQSPRLGAGGEHFAPLRHALVPLDRGWEYRWGDSPFDASGVPLWSREGEDGWRAIDFPSNPPDRQGRTNVWFRLRLPAFAGRDPRIFIYSIDLSAEFYLDGRLIYSFGHLDSEGKGRFLGWPWHLIDLPAGLEGRYLHVRLFSDYRDIGLWGEIILGSGADHMRRIMKRDGIRLLVAAVSLALSSVFLLLFFLRQRQRSLLFLSLIALALVVRVFGETQVKQFILYAPLFFEYVKASSYFILPVFIVLFVQEFLGSQYRRLTRTAYLVVLAIFALTMLSCLAGWLRICDTYLLFDFISIGTMVFLALLSAKAAVAGNSEARLVCLNFVIFGILTLYSVLVANGVFPWVDEINYLLLFQFSVGLAVILIRRLLNFQRQLQEYSRQLKAQSEELQSLNQSLEDKVSERTRQLELANRRLREEKITLQLTSITDGLTGVHNRTYALERYEQEVGEARRYHKRLSVIMFDLDHFKRVNDFHGHQVGDAVLQRVAEIFKSTLRESDLIGRYGGEEFLIVLPETDCAEAAMVAERIRQDIEAQSWSEPDLRVTISGGVAEWSGEGAEQLLQRADSLMYRAKDMGRNRIVSETELHRRAGEQAG